MPESNKSRIAQDVLSYLSEHLDAKDTFEGIVEWWLLEQKIERHTEEVREVLNELTEKGLLVKHEGKDSRVHYSLNRKQVKNIRALLKAGNQR